MLTLAMLLAAGIAASLSHAAQARNLTYNEFKFGVLAHDVRFLGGKEDGVDINPELILASPVNDSWVERLPVYLRWPLQPRPTIGLEINTAGNTDQYYFGATWSWKLFSDLVTPSDGLAFSIFFGPGFNDGEVHSVVPDRKSLGGHVLFRVAFELGYMITPVYQISAYMDHISNGGFDRYNQSINDVGARFGIRF